MAELIDQLHELLGAGGVLRGDEARSRSGAWGVNHCAALVVLRPRWWCRLPAAATRRR